MTRHISSSSLSSSLFEGSVTASRAGAICQPYEDNFRSYVRTHQGGFQQGWTWAPVMCYVCGGILGGLEVYYLSPSDVVMSWLRLQQASDCITHLYWMYTKCFVALIWCVWAYGSTLTQLGLCRWGLIMVFWGRSEPGWCCNITMVEATKGFRLDLTSILDVYKVFWYLDMVRVGIWVHPYYTVRTVQARLVFWGILGIVLSLRDVVMSWFRLQQASD